MNEGERGSSEVRNGEGVCVCARVCVRVCVFGERGLFMVVSSRFVSLGQSRD